jgi:polysaccharide pyruvyl transferase WcaK-like protein
MIHHIYANRSNAGDWASALGIQSLLCGVQVKEHFCDRPFVRGTIKALRAAGPGDLIVVGGGGLLMDYFAPFWEALLELPADAALCLWSPGLCDLKAEPSRPDPILMREVVARAALCHVRDGLTRDFLGGDPLPPPVLCPSLAFIAPHEPGRGILHVDNYTTVGAEAFDRMDGIARAFGARGRFPFRRTNNRLEGRPTRAGLETILELYRASHIVLSSALHGCIFAAAMGRPVVAVSGDRKIDAFMSAIGLEAWVVDPTETDRVPDLLAAAAAQPSVSARVAEAVQANQALARKILALAAAPAHEIRRTG